MAVVAVTPASPGIGITIPEAGVVIPYPGAAVVVATLASPGIGSTIPAAGVVVPYPGVVVALVVVMPGMANTGVLPAEAPLPRRSWPGKPGGGSQLDSPVALL